ncbi:MAG: T9SS type A sorting domain-containing protein [Flavobacterium sp.]|uniref:golvesin C-terminal-like domain-containing protein n=1 Tax=Flavobacterium sp. TaxID=239 RepID=UPI001B296240|nr:N-acetylmuramoyl-L-alanine amidase [Flavobacterium sp.]MBO9583597.1 T9SS type A sorting domain-containing protein [Flavobacterium sp.]
MRKNKLIDLRNQIASIMVLFSVATGLAQTTPDYKKPSDEQLYSLADKYLKSSIKKETKPNGEVFLQRDMGDYLALANKKNEVTSKPDLAEKHDELECEHNGELLKEYLNRPHPSVKTMVKYFTEASKEFDVPVEILMAVGQVQSNWAQVSSSFYGSWGVMGLIESDYNNQIAVAAKLIKSTPEAIKTDAKTNIRAATALLKSYQKKTNPKGLEDWFDATRELTGLKDEEMKTSLAERFFKVIKEGSKTVTLWKEIIDIKGSTVTIPLSKTSKSSTAKASATEAVMAVDYPGALSRITACNYGVGRNGYGIDYYFVHYMATGTYEGAISYFNDCSRTTPTSAHYCIRNSDGQISQVVREADRAYSQGVSGYPQWNGAGVSTEHEVLATNLSMWDSQPMLDAAAALAIDVCDRSGVPKTRRVTNGNRGIYGHNDVNSGTDCPNLTTARWNVLLAKIAAGSSTNVPVPTAPTAGQVYVSTPVNFTWDSSVTNADYRIQVSKSNTGWNDTDGFTSTTTPNSTVVVNDVVNTVKSYSWNTTSAAVAESPIGGTVYYYTIRSYSAATGTSKYSAPVSFTPKSTNCTVPGITSITVDNLAATLVGAWTSTSATAGYIGTDYIHDGDTGKGAKSATFTPSIAQRGRYEVFINFTAGTNRPTNVPVDIIHESGTTTVTVNQQINNGTWVSLGTYNFSSGSAGKAVIRTTGTTGVVIADAFKFTFVDCLPENTAPVANFTPAVSTVCAGQTVAYTSTSTNATSYSWSFPGGTPSTSPLANPVVTYNTTGTYDASLTAINSIGSDTKTVTGLVTVNPAVAVTAGFTAPLTELAIGESVTLTNTSTGATAYSWTFPNGSPATSTAVNPSVSFTTVGSKTVTLVASNACGSNTYTMTFCVGSNTTTTLETFEASAGRFTQVPTTSGSTVGIATTSTLARATDSFKNGTASLKAVLYDNTSVTTDWLVRLLSGGGTPANNQAFVGNQGSFGFWLKTSTANAGATVTAWIDDVDGLEELPPQTIINNGVWNYYEWFLPTAVGTTITTGNGIVGGASVTLDAIVIKQSNTANTMTVWIDDIQHNYISGCSGTRKMLDTAADVEDVKIDGGLVVYPNPTNGILNLSLENNTKSDVRLYNALGQQLLNTTFEGSTQQLDLNNFGRGIYLLQVISDDKVTTKKIILSK